MLASGPRRCRAGAACGEGGEDGVGDGCVVAVAVGVGGDLDGLGGFAGVHLLPAGGCRAAPRGEGVVRAGRATEERSRLIRGVHELGDSAPTRLWAHLEQTQGVVVGAVAVVGVVRALGVGAGVRQHPQRGLGERGHERDLDPGLPTPSVLLPMAMIVAAWVSCCRFSVNVSPFAVVTVSESGTGPS